MADLERSDTVVREPSMRAKTIIIPTVISENVFKQRTLDGFNSKFALPI